MALPFFRLHLLQALANPHGVKHFFPKRAEKITVSRTTCEVSFNTEQSWAVGLDDCEINLFLKACYYWLLNFKKKFFLIGKCTV